MEHTQEGKCSYGSSLSDHCSGCTDPHSEGTHQGCTIEHGHTGCDMSTEKDNKNFGLSNTPQPVEWENKTWIGQFVEVDGVVICLKLKNGEIFISASGPSTELIVPVSGLKEMLTREVEEAAKKRGYQRGAEDMKQRAIQVVGWQPAISGGLEPYVEIVKTQNMDVMFNYGFNKAKTSILEALTSSALPTQ